MNFFKAYKGLPKGMYFLFLAQVINRFGDFVRPFLALFLTKSLGFTNSQAGAAVMVVTIATVPGAFLGARLSDQLGRKKTYLIFQGLAGLMILLCAFISVPFLLVVFLTLASFFNGGVRPMISAMVTDILTPEKRQVGFSLSYLGINVGVATGPLVAGFLFNNYINLLFIGDALTTVIAILLVMLFIHIPDQKELNQASEMEAHEEGTFLQAIKARPFLVIFFAINILYAFSYAQSSFALPLALDQIFQDLGPRNYGLLMSANAITCVSTTLLITHVTKKIKPINVIVLGGIAEMIGFGMIAFITDMPLFFLSTIIWTLGEILVSINYGVFISHRSPQNFRARFNAISSLSWSIGALVGSYFIGVYMDSVGIQAVWPLVAVVSGLGALGMYILGRLEKKKKYH